LILKALGLYPAGARHQFTGMLRLGAFPSQFVLVRRRYAGALEMCARIYPEQQSKKRALQGVQQKSSNPVFCMPLVLLHEKGDKRVEDNRYKVEPASYIRQALWV
jgi:hypothetical protein